MLKDELVVAKISSNIINNDELLKRFLKIISLLHACQAQLLLVHDTSTAVDNALEIFGLDKTNARDMHMSDHKSAGIVEMVLSGHIGKKIVSKLSDMGCNALGISGKDCDIIRATQRLKQSTNDKIVNFDFTSDPITLNAGPLLTLLESNMIVVFSPVASSEDGITCIIDPNVTTSLLASALAAKYMILPCARPNIDSSGVMMTDFDMHQLHQMRSDPKSSDEFKLMIDTATSAIDNDVDYVCMVDEEDPESILQTIFCTEDAD